LQFSGKQHENPRLDETKVMTHVGKSTERRAITQTGMMNSAKSGGLHSCILKKRYRDIDLPQG
jgi:hypothetical protein